MKSIAEGITVAEDFDTLLIKKGTYKEFNFLITKPLTLFGENYPVIDGEDQREIIRIASDNVTVDGLFLMSLIVFKEYPLDSFSLAATMFNPIDLSRTLILLKLDISALLGYTGAVFKQFFGTNQGLIISMFMLILWTVLPIWRLVSKSKKKDF